MSESPRPRRAIAIPPPRKPRAWLVVTTCLLLIAGGGAAAYFTGLLDNVLPQEIPRSGSTAPVGPSLSHWPLTGLNAGVEDRPGMIAEISNDLELRPHEGLEAADIVFEGIDDQGLSVLTPFFHSTLPAQLSGVMSLTDPYLWPPGYEVYSGGQSSNGTRNLGGFPDRFCEFDIQEQGSTAQRLGTMATSVWVYLSDHAEPRWAWDYHSNQWLRWEGSVPAMSNHGVQLAVSNVLILDIDSSASPGMNPILSAVGQGTGVVVSGQMVAPIVWTRESLSTTWQFLDEFGDPVLLIPGTTWIELLPKDTGFWLSI